MPDGGIFEGFYDCGHGIQYEHPLFSGRDGTQGVNDGCGIHPQLHGKLQEEGKVAVLGGEGGKDNPETQAQTCCHQDQQRKQKDVEVWIDEGSGLEVIPGIKHKKYTELYEKAHQIGDGDGNGHYQPGEIYFPEHGLVVDEDFAVACQAFSKIVPQNNAAKIKEGSRNAICGDAGQPAKHKHKHDGGHHGLYGKPQRS